MSHEKKNKKVSGIFSSVFDDLPLLSILAAILGVLAVFILISVKTQEVRLAAEQIFKQAEKEINDSIAQKVFNEGIDWMLQDSLRLADMCFQETANFNQGKWGARAHFFRGFIWHQLAQSDTTRLNNAEQAYTHALELNPDYDLARWCRNIITFQRLDSASQPNMGIITSTMYENGNFYPDLPPQLLMLVKLMTSNEDPRNAIYAGILAEGAWENIPEFRSIPEAKILLEINRMQRRMLNDGIKSLLNDSIFMDSLRQYYDLQVKPLPDSDKTQQLR